LPFLLQVWTVSKFSRLRNVPSATTNCRTPSVFRVRTRSAARVWTRSVASWYQTRRRNVRGAGAPSTCRRPDVTRSPTIDLWLRSSCSETIWRRRGTTCADWTNSTRRWKPITSKLAASGYYQAQGRIQEFANRGGPSPSFPLSFPSSFPL